MHIKKLSFSDQFAKMNDWALQRVQRAAIPTPAYVWAVENELPCNPDQFEQEAQNKADFLESVLLADGETTRGQRTACTIAVTFFESCGVLDDSDVYGTDRAGLVAKCKLFAYGPIDRAAEQERDAQRLISEA